MRHKVKAQAAPIQSILNAVAHMLWNCLSLDERVPAPLIYKQRSELMIALNPLYMHAAKKKDFEL
jgi:hypothetical protein